MANSVQWVMVNEIDEGASENSGRGRETSVTDCTEIKNQRKVEGTYLLRQSNNEELSSDRLSRTEECRIQDWISMETGLTRSSRNSLFLEELWSSRELSVNSEIAFNCFHKLSSTILHHSILDDLKIARHYFTSFMPPCSQIVMQAFEPSPSVGSVSPDLSFSSEITGEDGSLLLGTRNSSEPGNSEIGFLEAKLSANLLTIARAQVLKLLDVNRQLVKHLERAITDHVDGLRNPPGKRTYFGEVASLDIHLFFLSLLLWILCNVSVFLLQG
ncbi:hypothetical protein ACJRO7_010336 [Eucalyptus globulus]|uniref:Uncharacterized protein n=1 Tax=Eucalyptus globulus TaxID=34317 RepID=A0ABD3LBR9_EUCGL